MTEPPGYFNSGLETSRMRWVRQAPVLHWIWKSPISYKLQGTDEAHMTRDKSCYWLNLQHSVKLRYFSWKIYLKSNPETFSWTCKIMTKLPKFCLDKNDKKVGGNSRNHQPQHTHTHSSVLEAVSIPLLPRVLFAWFSWIHPTISLQEALTYPQQFGIENASNTYYYVSFPFLSLLQVCGLLNSKNPLITGFGKIIHLGA